MSNVPSHFKKLIAGIAWTMGISLSLAITHAQSTRNPTSPGTGTGTVTTTTKLPATGSGIAVGEILKASKDYTASEGSAMLEELLYAPAPLDPSISEAPLSGPRYSQGLADILYGLDGGSENILTFGDSAVPTLPVGPYPAPLTRTFYYAGDTIRIFTSYPGSVLEIYWLDNPDTFPEPANLFAAQVGDDGVTSLEAALLPIGSFVFANTFPEAKCGGWSLQECRLRKEYLGEFAVLVGSGSTLPGSPTYDPFALLRATPTP